MNLGPIGFATLGTGHRWSGRIQHSFEGFIVEQCRPAHTGQSGTSAIIPDHALSDPDAKCDQMLAFSGGSKSQELSYLSHGQPRCWHFSLPLLVGWTEERYVVVLRRGVPGSWLPVKSDRDGLESLTGIAWNERPGCHGMDHRLPVESLTGIAWNTHPGRSLPRGS